MWTAFWLAGASSNHPKMPYTLGKTVNPFDILPSEGQVLSMFKTVGLRRIGRQALAITFWMHALYGASFLHLPRWFALHQPKYLSTLILALVIVFYSLLGELEWLSLLADCFYVYLWPCIISLQLSWFLIKAIYKYLKANLVIQSPGLIVRPVVTKTPPVIPTKDTSTKKSTHRGIVGWVLKPFTEFSLLWSLMILTSENRLIIVTATSVAVFCAGRALYELWAFTSDASSWIDKLKGTFAKQIATHIGKVRAWEEMTQIDEVTKAANALKMLESIFTFIADNNKFLARTTAAFAVCVSVIFYCYISFVFSCAYVGMAKLQGIAWSWSESFVTSLYMPMAYTNLPRNLPIELIGGLQGVAIIVLGWNIFFRHMSSGFKRIAIAASELREPFEDRVLQVKYSLIQEQMAKVVPVTPITPSLGVVPDIQSAESRAQGTNEVARKGFRQSKKKGRNR
jgi:hypothetical protein